MKTTIIKICTSLIILGGCSKEQFEYESINQIEQPSGQVIKPNNVRNSKPINGQSSSLAVWPKIHFSFTFGGFPECNGEDGCGGCPGICIEINFSTVYSDLTEEQRNDGYGLADMTLLENNTVKLVPDRDMDNGDGYVRITDDYELPQDVATYLGLTSGTIEEGTYLINYSEYSPYGHVILNLK